MEHPALVDRQFRRRPDGDHHYYIWEMRWHRAAFNLRSAAVWLVLRETYFFVGRAELDCLEGGTHEETLRPQVNPKV